MRGRLGARRGERGGGHLADHVAHRLRRAGRLVGEHVGGVTRVAEQRRALGAQLDELRDHRALSVAPLKARLIEAR